MQPFGLRSHKGVNFFLWPQKLKFLRSGTFCGLFIIKKFFFDANYQDRSPSPARNRSRSPTRRRDYEAPRDGGRRNSRSDKRGDDRRSDRGDDRRGGFRREGRERERRANSGDNSNRNYENSIFIGNVPFESTTRDIEDMFDRVGRIVHAGVISTKGRSRGMAFVEFDNKQAAKDAIQKYNNTSLGGREIFVRQDLPPPEERRRDDRRDRRDNDSRRNERSDRNDRHDRNDRRDRNDRNDRNDRSDRRDERPRERRERASNDLSRAGIEVFVGNLPFSTTWHTLKDMFREAGDVIRADVMTKFGKSRGFGIVVFGNAEDADNAIAKYNNYVLDGRNLEVRLGREQGERKKPASKNSAFTEGVHSNGEPSSTIFVGNLPFITSQTDLFELFETIGRVTKAEIQFNNSGRASGNAVVEFELMDLADLAIKNLDRYNYGGRELEITFAKFPSGQSANNDDEVMDQDAVDSNGDAVNTPVAQINDPADAAMDVPVESQISESAEISQDVV